MGVIRGTIHGRLNVFKGIALTSCMVLIAACALLAAGPATPGGGLPGLPTPTAASPPASQPGDLITPAASMHKEGVTRTIFAAPCENATGKDEFEATAAAVSDLVAVMLAQQDKIAVVERQQLASLTAEQAKSLAGLTGQDYSVKAGKLLKADTVMAGRLFVVKDGGADKLTVSVQVIDIASERVAAAGQAACRPDDLVEAAMQVATKLGEQMKLPLPPIDPTKIDKSPIASLHFAKGLSSYHGGNMDLAILGFMRAVDADPDYAEARYWMGMAYHRLGEHAHAAIEWREFIRRQPNSKLAGEARKLLAEAEQQDKASTVPRLGPGAGRQ